MRTVGVMIYTAGRGQLGAVIERASHVVAESSERGSRDKRN